MTKRSRAEAELPYTYHPQIPYTFKERAGLNLSKRRKMSADVHERLAFKQETTLFRYCEGNLSFSSSNDDDCNYNRKKMSRDPMSHRIIEKRRRDRMNNCLADLSRLIPPEYLKKGRGRIEKTEIIEMAIKHMRHLQNVIANARYSENSDFSAPSPPEANRDQQTILNDPINVKHFRMGYVECLSEAMHYLVDVQGYFAGDSLCVQMINHLHKHCDQFLKGNTLNFQRRVAGEARTVATSPIALRPLSNSPVSSSTGVPSDDNLSTQTCDSSLATVVAAARQLEEGGRTEPIHFRSPKRYSDGSYRPKARLDNYSRCSESEGGDTESRSDVELQQCFALKCRTNENRKEEPGKSFLSSFESSGNFSSKSYVSSEEITSTDDSSYDTSSKDDRVKGPSQLREMLTSPATVGQMNGHVGKSSSDSKESSSTANSSDDSSIQGGHFKPCSLPQNLSFKSHLAVAENHEGNGDIAEGMHSDNHHMMYKFKNNIKQRFSKENRETAENELEMHAKRLKLEESPKPMEMMETDFRRKHRHASESDVADVDIGNRLSFGHKSNERPKRWDEPNVNMQNQNNSKFWPLSPYPSTSFNNLQQGAACMKPIGRQETPTMMSNSLNALTISDPTPGVPIFALHAKGSFYIPLTLDQASLAPFLPILGITKTDEEVEQNTLLHPVTISVNFQSQSTQPPSRAMSC